MNIINWLAHAKFNTSKMHRIPKPQKNVPANNCHLKVVVVRSTTHAAAVLNGQDSESDGDTGKGREEN